MILETGTEYYLAWLLYLLAILSAQFLVWRVIRLIPIADLRVVIMLLVFGLFITPLRLEPEQSYWVPAFMMATMDFINGNTEEALESLSTILIVIFVLLLLSIVSKWVKSFLVRSSSNSDSSSS